MQNQNKRGQFITLEGIEGAGKSTALEFLARYLTQQKIAFKQVREPGGTPIAELIREQVLKAKTNEKLAPVSELLLMFAARAQNLQENILPALESGQWVICDRFTDATYAYQGGGRQLPIKHIEVLENFLGPVIPNLTLLLDLPLTVSQARLKARNSGYDRIEQESSDFFERVRNMYLSRAKNEPHRFVIIDADKSLIDVQKQIEKAIDQFILREKNE